MVRGVGSPGDDIFGAETADDVSRLVKLGIRGEGWTRAVIPVREALPGQLDRSRSNVSRIRNQIAEMPFHAQGPGLQVGIAKAGSIQLIVSGVIWWAGKARPDPADSDSGP